MTVPAIAYTMPAKSIVPRYGVRYPDGSVTGPISDSWRLANDYAKEWKAVVVDYKPAEPEAKIA